MGHALSPSASAETLFQAVLTVVAANLPSGITQSYFQGFVRRNRTQMVTVIEQALRARRGGMPAVEPEGPADMPDLWTPARRTRANLLAMQLLADKEPDEMGEEDRAVLRRYSGWGGLSIEAVKGKVPPGMPLPDDRGLIHEFYTPAKVVREVARVVKPLVDSLPKADGKILALEPSAGIGRFIQAASGPGFQDLDWQAVEWSALSARMLGAMRPDVPVFEGPFERWVREQGPSVAGRLGLILSNPPYGQRGVSITEDPDRSYREKNAYAYFLRRSLDLLARGGLGVFLVPAGFLTGRGAANISLREKILRRHHLSCAYRLPSDTFPGAHLVTDLLFIRARGGELGEVDVTDTFILEGRYFEEFPEHILGTEIGKDGGEDDQTRKARFGYQVAGEFKHLPDLVERPFCEACEITAEVIPFPQTRRPKGSRGGIARTLETDITGLSEHAASAVLLGARVDRYLSLLSAEASDEHVQLWPELSEALAAWRKKHGNPWASTDLQKLKSKGNAAAERFLGAFEKSGSLVAAVATQPTYSPRFTGRLGDVGALADWMFRQHRRLTLTDLAVAWAEQQGQTDPPNTSLSRFLPRLPALLDAGWCIDGDAWDELLPEKVYLSGHLWPRFDRAEKLLDSRAKAKPEPGTWSHVGPWNHVGTSYLESQVRRLRARIAPAVFEDIEGVSPRQGWVPLELVGQWMAETENLNKRYGNPGLVRRGGLVEAGGVSYEDIEDVRAIGPNTRLCIGWINHDKTVFKPRSKKDENIDEKRLEMARAWDQSFRAWVSSNEARKAQVERAYNRNFRGFVQPDFDAEPLAVARWNREGVRPHPHQVAGARRVLENRGGLLAFDVGVGKTYTGILVLARARQEGWCRRPVVLVPNSIVWKWHADIKRVLPDYRILVIGSKPKLISRGPRKGHWTSETDTPEDRARKWTAFQAGEADVVLLTYSAMPRTKMNLSAIRAYADSTAAIQREVRLRQRNAADSKKRLSERQEAILKEGVAAWIAEMTELPPKWEHDPGPAWDDIGVDLLIVDEAQNYKNLYLPEAREGGVPRFMGNAGDGSKRAWQLDFRCAAVRRRTGGAGVVLLSATPAKNSPLEFYSLIQYVDHDAWKRHGIYDPEQFIDRYLKIEMKEVIDSKLDVVERSAVVGFQNLHELRDIIFRFSEFKTAEDVGLKLPEPTVNVLEVEMNAEQDAKYEKYVGQIEDALQSDNMTDKGKVLGLLARMALVAIHQDLDEGYDWKTAGQAADNGIVEAESPKFAELARRVKKNRSCGHIVFVDNIAAHRWVVQTLVSAGIPEDRIAVLNAEVAKAAADRQRIAREFNGNAEEGEAPKYDVVICNAVAYEGIDLQTRTCAIHHLDLPWEPATLQQRNGRGVRQGNKLGSIEINYYFSKRSQDGMRFNLIQGKLGWMVELLKSQKRDTNNPGAQMELGPEEILLLISRDPEKTRRRLEEVKARRAEEARKKMAEDAGQMLRAANARFRKAERTRDPAEALRLREEGEERLKDLAKVDTEAWPWAGLMYAVRDREVLVLPNGGPPLYEGLRFGIPDTWNPEKVQYVELGRGIAMEDTIGFRRDGAPEWHAKTLGELGTLKLKPEHFTVTWPADDEARADAALPKMRGMAVGSYSYDDVWQVLRWPLASDAWVERAWAFHGDRVTTALAQATSYVSDRHHVPVLDGGVLRIARGRALQGRIVLPPTAAGWQDFLNLAPASELKWGELDLVARFWWARKLPRNLLSSATAAEEAA